MEKHPFREGAAWIVGSLQNESNAKFAADLAWN